MFRERLTPLIERAFGTGCLYSLMQAAVKIHRNFTFILLLPLLFVSVMAYAVAGVIQMRSFRRGVLLVGIPISAMLLLISAAFATAKEFSTLVYILCGAVALAAGGFFAALYHCRMHRHKGLLHGLLCGLAVTAFWLCVAWVINSHTGVGFPALWGMLGGMAGGIYGVNLPAPTAKKHSHCDIHARKYINAMVDAFRKRRYHKPWQMPENPINDVEK